MVRDGLGLELLDPTGNVVAEVFRADADKTLHLNTFSYDVSVDSIEAISTIRALQVASSSGIPLHEFDSATAGSIITCIADGASDTPQRDMQPRIV